MGQICLVVGSQEYSYLIPSVSEAGGEVHC